MQVLKGQPLSPGLARGTAFIYRKSRLPAPPRRRIEPEDAPAHYRRFRTALEHSREELENLQRHVLAELGQAESNIFGAHLALLDDQTFASKVRDRIEQDLVNVEHAVQEEIADLARLLAEVDHEYLRERAKDVEDVGRRVLKHLSHGPEEVLRSLPEGSVLVASELLPSDTLNLDRQHVAALVLEHAGQTGHAAILARNLGIPAVCGIDGVCATIPQGAEVLVDAESGRVTVSPENPERNHFSAASRSYARRSEEAFAARGEACVTRDETRVGLWANIGRPEEADAVQRHCLDGVGLFRTEYLFMDSADPPEEATQRSAYEEAVRRLGDLPLTIRTLDLGGDKQPRFLRPRFERNPDLGVRGLRFSLQERDLLRTQLRALLEAAQGGAVRVLFPMVMGGSDLREAVDELRRAAEAVGVESLPPVGAMIETPSALFELEEILAVADFLSLGTNDLVQFMMAADREATETRSTKMVLQPSVLRAVSRVVETAEAYEKPVAVCGEAAADPATACLLVGLGIRELSMNPVSADRVRQAIRAQSADGLADLASNALNAGSEAEVATLLQGRLSP